MHATRHRFVFLLLVNLPASGCLPDGVVWTPDGKSLLYTEDRGTRVVRYDLAARERHILEENTNTQTTWPAVSPDGKLIAVARSERDGTEPGTLAIVLLDREGQEVKSSKAFPWLPADKKGKGKRTFATGLCWDAAAKRILVFSEDKTGIYDPDKEALIALDKVIPFPLRNAPGRADGKGFLALLANGDRTEIAFVGWDGTVHKIERGDRELKTADLVWDKDIARLIGPNGVLELDTTKLTAAFHPEAKPALLPADGELASIYTFPGGPAQVCVYDWTEKGKAVDIAQQRVEVQLPGDKKRVILERRTRGIVALFPSPDRKLVAVRYRPEGRPTQVIAIIDGSGKVVQEIDVKD